MSVNKDQANLKLFVAKIHDFSFTYKLSGLILNLDKDKLFENKFASKVAILKKGRN